VPFEEGEAGVAEMRKTMGRIMKLGEALRRLWLDKGGGYEPRCALAGELQGLEMENPKGHVLDLSSSNVIAPQVTGAIRLDQVFKVMGPDRFRMNRRSTERSA
jgi:hypothetical protein